MLLNIKSLLLDSAFNGSPPGAGLPGRLTAPHTLQQVGVKTSCKLFPLSHSFSTGQDEYFVALGNKQLKHPACLRFIALAHPLYPILPSEANDNLVNAGAQPATGHLQVLDSLGG